MTAAMHWCVVTLAGSVLGLLVAATAVPARAAGVSASGSRSAPSCAVPMSAVAYDTATAWVQASRQPRSFNV